MKIIVPKVFTSAAIQNTSYSLELDGNIHYKCHAIHHLPVRDVVMPIDEQPHDHWRHEAHGVAQRVDHACDIAYSCQRTFAKFPERASTRAFKDF